MLRTTVITSCFLLACGLSILKSDGSQEIVIAENSPVQLGLQYLKDQQYELAIKAFSKGIDEGISGYTVIIGRAEAFYKLGRYEEALDDASKAIATNTDFPYGYTLRAAIYGRMGHVDLSIKDLTQNIALEPTNGALYYLRALCYLELEKPNKALNDLDEALTLGENFSKIHYTRGVALLNSGRYREALVDYSKVLERQPSHYTSKSLNNRGLIYYCLGEFDKAIQDFSMILDEQPANLKAHLSRGYVYLDSEQYDMALKDFSYGINRDLNDSYFYADLAHIYHRLGKYPKAIEANRKAIALSSDNLAKADSHLQQGLLLLIQGQDTEAMTAFSKGIVYSEQSASSEILDWIVEEIRIWNASLEEKSAKAEEIIKKIQNVQLMKQPSALQGETNTCVTPRLMWVIEK